jgi:Retroviral aspartyl protease
MTIVGLYPAAATTDPPAKVAFYLPIDPANAGGNDNIKYYVTPFDEGDAEALLTFVHDFQELIRLKQATNNYEQQVQIVRLLLRDQALEKFNEEYVDPTITPVDPAAANDIQEATRLQNLDNRRVSFNDAIQGLLERSLPTMAGKNIKEEIKRFRKPFDMSVEDFFQRMTKINKFIGLCPGPDRQYDEHEMRSILEQACPQSWYLDLKKQTAYPTMTLNQMKAYYKLLENAEGGSWERQTQRNRRGYLGLRGGNPRAAGRGAQGQSSGRRIRGGGGGHGGGGHGGGGQGGGNNNPPTPPRNQGAGGRAGGRPVQASRAGGTGGRGVQPGARRSDRRRGMWCPHCRTSEHDGSNCDLYQAYRAGRDGRQRPQENNRGAEANVMISSRGKGNRRATTNDYEESYGGRHARHDELNSLDVHSGSDLDEELYCMDCVTDEQEVFVTTRSMTTMYEPEQLTRVPDATIIVQLALDQNRKKFRALIDSGASLSLAPHYAMTRAGWKRLEHPVNVRTKTGSFETEETAELEIILPDFSPHRIVSFQFHSDTSRNPRYDFILGRDFLQHTGMTLNYREQVFQWEEMSVAMPFAHRSVREVEAQNETNPNRYQFVPHGEIEAVLPTNLLKRVGYLKRCRSSVKCFYLMLG